MTLSNILYFYTEDCEICRQIAPELRRLEEKYDDVFIRVDIEEGEDEKNLFDELALDVCGGIPFMYNQNTGAYICGFATSKQIEETLLD